MKTHWETITDFRGHCLTLVSTASIQDYVFRSNRLRDNLGAAALVREAIDCWADHPSAVFTGGGNAVLIFPNKPMATDDVWEWSNRLIRDAPGLRLSATHQVIGGSVREAYMQAQKALREFEERPPLGFELGALPVVRRCTSTNYAASTFDNKSRSWIGAEARAKRDRSNAVPDAIESELKALLGEEYDFTDELSALGTISGAAHIAIVHADGDGIGKVLSPASALLCDKDGADFLRELKALSLAVAFVANNAFLKTIGRLKEAIPKLIDRRVISLAKNELGKRVLPIRPVIYGGDDLTFVCHGRLGLALAVVYCELFREMVLSSPDLNDKGLTASAGIFIQPEKFPFARGYQLAKELAANAKAARRAAKTLRDLPPSGWLDFHIITEASTGTIERTRERLYTVEGRKVLGRPYAIGDSESSQSWKKFISAFDSVKKLPRSVAKRWFQAMAKGQVHEQQVKQAIESRTPELLRACLDGHEGGVLFDALEAIDFYQPLTEREENRAVASD